MRRSYSIFSTLLLSSLVIILYTYLTPRFGTVDDVLFHFLLHGKYICSQPQSILYYIHLYWSEMLLFVQNHYPTHNILPLSYILLQGMSIWLFKRVLGEKVKVKNRNLIVVFVSFLAILFLVLQYTTVTLFIAAISLYTLIYSTRSSNFIYAYILWICAALLRIESVLMVALFIFPLFVYYWYISKQWITHAHIRLVIATILSAGIMYSYVHSLDSTAEKDFIRSNQTRVRFVDEVNQMDTESSEFRQSLNAAFWSHNDLDILKVWMDVDPEVYSQKNMDKFLAKHQSFSTAISDNHYITSISAYLIILLTGFILWYYIINKTTFLHSKTCKRLLLLSFVLSLLITPNLSFPFTWNNFLEPTHLPLLPALLGVLTIGFYGLEDKETINKLFFIGLGLFALTAFLFLFRKPPPFRVYIALVSFLAIYWVFSAKIKGFKMGILVALIAYTSLISWNSLSTENEKKNKLIQRDWSALHNMNKKLIVCTNYGFVYDRWPVFAPMSEFKNNNVFPLITYNTTALFQSQLKQKGIQNLYESLFKDDDVVLLLKHDHDLLLDRYKKYVQEHYNLVVKEKIVFQNESFKVLNFEVDRENLLPAKQHDHSNH